MSNFKRYRICYLWTSWGGGGGVAEADPVADVLGQGLGHVLAVNVGDLALVGGRMIYVELH